MKIGLYFGSFNPVHNGHMIIAGYVSEFTDLDQVWLVVSPHNPLKPKQTLLNDYQRLAMVKLAIREQPEDQGHRYRVQAPEAELYDRHHHLPARAVSFPYVRTDHGRGQPGKF